MCAVVLDIPLQRIFTSLTDMKRTAKVHLSSVHFSDRQNVENPWDAIESSKLSQKPSHKVLLTVERLDAS